LQAGLALGHGPWEHSTKHYKRKAGTSKKGLGIIIFLMFLMTLKQSEVLLYDDPSG
jgi:hypothetical protein